MNDRSERIIGLGIFFIAEVALWWWVWSFDGKAAIIMGFYGFICACRGGMLSSLRESKKPDGVIRNSHPARYRGH
jgi:hypothetical protein